MCILLCANPTARAWLEADTALAHRQWLQMTAVCPTDPLARSLGVEQVDRCGDGQLRYSGGARDDVAVILCRRLVTHVYPNCLFPLTYGGAALPSAKEWYKPLQLLADAWRRLLQWVGWR
jgi:hypothetical protein